ncbi:MAG: DUF5916 domain-containing protein, partial [Candidatus Delongbacteria bacterium]|nr:DUF5916 domain-containing protein [Candidatus Delongbacteria bacterium]
MRYKITIIIIFIVIACVNVFANDEYTKREYYTKKTDIPPVIDGKINDPVWDNIDWADQFTEKDPDFDTPPSQSTKFKILYDDEYLYIAVRAYDTESEKISKKICSRDDFGTDWIEVDIDSYNDKRTAFSFNSTTCGSQGDEYVTGNGNSWDSSWSPVWFNQSQVDSLGWTTEFKIPFSQLRYTDDDEQVWGIQVGRRIHRFNERSYWQAIPQHAPLVSNYGQLHGLKGIKKSSSLELIPYNVWKVDHYKNDYDNKLKDGQDGEIKFGLDGKFRVTNNITSTFTINPDFGQVEADPANLNLSAFENFQWERRPFFIEGNDLFYYYCTSAMFGGYYSMDQLFYSRRIGRLPNGYSSDYDKSPTNTTILGAVKLTGKLENGMNIGFLESVTGRENAEWVEADVLHKQVIEPRTNYAVSRFSQNFNEENSSIGGIITSVIREQKYADELSLNRTAHTGGVDLQHKWNEGTYSVNGSFTASHITGTKETITNEQYSYNRYFQRPDADHLEIDENKESLTGFGGYLKIRKSRGNIVWENGATFRSPELELNDIGYMRSADVVAGWTYAGLRTLKPGDHFKFLSVNYNHRYIYNTDFKLESAMYNINSHNSLMNDFSFGGGVTYVPEFFSFTALEGGPTLRYPWNVSADLYLNSPEQKKINYGFGGWGGYSPEGSEEKYGLWTYLTIRFNDKFRFSFNPEFITDTQGDFYYDQTDIAGNREYLFAKLKQDYWNFKINANYCFTPRLSLKLFVSPYVVVGKYSEFKLINDADNSDR